MNDDRNRLGRIRETCAVIGGFVVLTLLMTFPLIAHIRTALPNDLGDPLLNAWILGWVDDRLLHGLRGFWQAPLFYPYPNTLAYSENLIGIAVIVAPVQWLWGSPILTYNIAFLFSYVLAGCGMYLLVKSFTGSRWAAAISGIAFAFCPYRAAQLPHLQMLMSGWMPLGLWALHRFCTDRKRRALLGFAAAYLLSGLSNGYSLYYFAVPVCIVAIDGLIRARGSRTMMAAELTSALLIVSAGLAPVLLVYYTVRNQQGLIRTVEEMQYFSADLISYFQTTPLLQVWGGILRQGKPEGELFSGATVLVLAALALATNYRRRGDVQSDSMRPMTIVYAIIGCLALVLSLGPEPRAWGVPVWSSGPYRWLLAIVPGLDGLRVPSRFAMIVFLALSVLAGIAVARFFSNWSGPVRTVVGLLLAVAILAEGYTGQLPYEQLPTLNAADTAAYAWLARQPPGGVLEFPMRGDEPTHSLLFQYRTLLHRHPIVNGFSGYRSPLFDLLSDASSPLFDATQIPAVLRGLRSIGVRYLVFHNASDPSLEPLKTARHDEQVEDLRVNDSTTTIQLRPLSSIARWNAKFLREISSHDFQASASGQQERLPLAFDGDLDTRWFNAERQSGDEWVALQFARPLTVARLRFEISPRSLWDYPRRLRVESSADGTHFETVLFEDDVLPVLLEGLARRARPIPLEIDLRPNVSRALRVYQTGETRTLYWSIDELQVWESRLQ